MTHLEQMTTAIKTWTTNNEYKPYAEVYSQIPYSQSAFIFRLIQDRAQKDLNSIVKGLDLLLLYERQGVKFEFLKYKTKD